MSLRVTLHPDAEAELHPAAHWYERQRTGLGLRLLDAVDDTLARIQRWPRAAALVRGICPLTLPSAERNYMITWPTSSRTTPSHVLAIAHDHRRAHTTGATARSSAPVPLQTR